ncbi:cation-transporting P-type ATPase [Carnobacterium maltaromaticum]|uniref:cation-translocating P-type ATPase n=1 Tax=Carnobacterium maltaromaticum TaxID=2751 RepID=UPI00298AA93A|nr:cation-transporting P-type ATPase [Carnobacterium maltaromaticum]MDW5524118.1 cation-transporting P-type ATPase [Carnobacterium maltaromaticum]
MKYYTKEKHEVLKEFDVTIESGLTDASSAANREKFGENKLKEEKADPYWRIFLRSFKEPIVIVLMGAIVLSFFSAYYDLQIKGDIKHGTEAIYEGTAILILILINATLSFWQEISAKKSLDALKQLSNRKVSVMRNGNWGHYDSVDLVPGDIVKVNVGDFIEADIRWLETSELQIIESHLTGEADAIQKQIDALEGDVGVGDQTNMGFSGSTVSNGSGIGIVVATGQQTELGKIAELLQNVESKPSPLQMTVGKLTRSLMLISGVVVVFTLVVGLFQSYQATGVLTFSAVGSVLSTAIALAVASIPDALPAVLSIVLTIGASKMAKNKGLIKSLSSVETLGATSYVCSDKTGTLTKNEMTVIKFFANGTTYSVSGKGYGPEGEITSTDSNAPSYHDFVKGAVLCNEAEVKFIDGKYKPFGNPTEVALTILGEKAQLKKESLLEQGIEIYRVLPFTSSRKMMSVIVKENNEYKLYTKGAPDILIEKSRFTLQNGNLVDTSDVKELLDTTTLSFANEALRTLAVAEKVISKEEAETGSVEELETGFTVTGIAGIIDPPRDEVRASVELLKEASVKVVMITGDHEATAKAIAYDLKIIDSVDAPSIKGAEIEKMSDEELFQRVKDTQVYARVSPEHKQRIVEQLQKHGEIVAMTGDGVNDAPALRAADIGIAMGIAGTEVTKDSADLILLDDKFTTIEKTVESGRTIYANIKNFIRHELTTNVAEVLSLLIGLLFFTTGIGQVSASTPTLTALMILWVNMVSDAIPSFSLGYDVAESDIMNEKPRDPKESVLANYTWSRVLIRGTVMGLTVFLAFVWAAKSGLSSNQAQTVAFLTLVYGQLWHVFDARSSKTLYRRNPFQNKHLIAAVLFAGISSYLVTIIPFFNTVMGTAPLSLNIYLLVLFVPAIPTLVLSGLKEIFGIKIW